VLAPLSPEIVCHSENASRLRRVISRRRVSILLLALASCLAVLAVLIVLGSRTESKGKPGQFDSGFSQGFDVRLDCDRR
jgi:hypothetical protein